MRTSLLEVQETDRFLFNKMSIADKLVFQARIIIDPVLEEKVRHQRKAHLLIRWWARKRKLENLHRQLMNNKDFSTCIHNIFK